MRSLRTKLYEAICSVLPVAALVLAVSFTPLAPLSWRERAVFALSALFLSLGIVFSLPVERTLGIKQSGEEKES